MKSLLTIFTLLLLLPVLAMAEDNDQETHAQGYVFAAPGKLRSSSTLHFGGGAEFDLYKGLGFSTDIGYISNPQCMGRGFGILSPNVRFAFTNANDSKLVPYITGGYSLLFRSSSANSYNFGGGIDYWFHDKAALKVEFRDHVWRYSSYSTYHIWQIRMGFSFR